MEPVLDAVEARVLGALMEKEATTPDYYPLSLNALVNACNQKSNRDPVMELDEDAVRNGLHGLAEKGLAAAASGADSRVSKYEHRMQEVFNFTRGEAALMCVLLLRGPQTPGELRGRTERVFRFEELSDVISALQRLMQREPPLARALPRQPGTKEVRYAHLLSAEMREWSERASSPVSEALVMGNAEPNRVAELESRVGTLEEELQKLKEQFAAFRTQFE